MLAHLDAFINHNGELRMVNPAFILALALLTNPNGDQVTVISSTIERAELVDRTTGANYGHVLQADRAQIGDLVTTLKEILGPNYAVKVDPYRRQLLADWHASPKIAERLINEAVAEEQSRQSKRR